MLRLLRLRSVDNPASHGEKVVLVVPNWVVPVLLICRYLSKLKWRSGSCIIRDLHAVNSYDGRYLRRFLLATTLARSFEDV
jgi:hypothetical protein